MKERYFCYSTNNIICRDSQQKAFGCLLSLFIHQQLVPTINDSRVFDSFYNLRQHNNNQESPLSQLYQHQVRLKARKIHNRGPTDLLSASSSVSTITSSSSGDVDDGRPPAVGDVEDEEEEDQERSPAVNVLAEKVLDLEVPVPDLTIKV